MPIAYPKLQYHADFWQVGMFCHAFRISNQIPSQIWFCDVITLGLAKSALKGKLFEILEKGDDYIRISDIKIQFSKS